MMKTYCYRCFLISILCLFFCLNILAQDEPPTAWMHKELNFSLADMLETEDGYIFVGGRREVYDGHSRGVPCCLKLDKEGELLQFDTLLDDRYYYDIPVVYLSPTLGPPCRFVTIDEGRTLFFACYTILEDSTAWVSCYDFDCAELTARPLFDLPFNHGDEIAVPKGIKQILQEKDGTLTIIEEFISPIKQDKGSKGVHLLMMNITMEGQVLKEKIIRFDENSNSNCSVIHNSDSTGYKAFCFRSSHPIFAVFSLDKDFNVTEETIYPFSFMYGAQGVSEGFLSYGAGYFQSPYNGKAYSVLSGDIVRGEHIYSALSIGKVDMNAESILFRLEDKESDFLDYGAYYAPVSFANNGEIYCSGYLQKNPNDKRTTLYLSSVDENLGNYKELYWGHFKEDETPRGVYVTEDGGCIYVTEHWPNGQKFYGNIYKFDSSLFDSVEEAHNHGLKLAIAYPNPGNVALNIRTALQDATVEVYDVQGRKVAEQAIGGLITTLDTENWPSGMYLWNVLQDGKVSETGKWVKE